MKRLSKDEMKKVMGGQEDPRDGIDDGNCQERDEKCSSANHLNCCSGLVCAEYKCKIATA